MPTRTGMSRRDTLRLMLAALATPDLAWAKVARGFSRAAQSKARLDQSSFVYSSWRVVPAEGETGAAQVRVSRTWTGPHCRAHAVNEGPRPVRLKEIVLFDVPLDIPPESSLYGEGFQMLSQTGGTLGQPADLGNYTDPQHYRLAEPEGARAVYGLVTLASPRSEHVVAAFTSCRRFSGKFYVRPNRLEVVVDAEGLPLGPKEQEFRFHATAIYATGGMILSGDDLTTVDAGQWDMLRKLQPPTGVAARFGDDSLSAGIVELPFDSAPGRKGDRAVCLLNWDDAAKAIPFSLPGPHRLREIWTNEDRGRHEGGRTSMTVPPHGGRVVLCTPA